MLKPVQIEGQLVCCRLPWYLISCIYARFLKCRTMFCLFLEIKQYEGRVRQIFITSVNVPSALKDGQRKKAGVEFAGNIDHVRELVTRDEESDVLVNAVVLKRGMPRGTLLPTRVRLQQVHHKKRPLEALATASTERNGSIEAGSKRILATVKTAGNKRRNNKKEIEKLLDLISNDEYFPVDTICPYLGLRKEPYIRLKNSLSKNKYCVRRQPPLEECQKASRDYEVESPPERCDEQTEKDLCTITDKWRSSANAKVKIRCNIGRCGKNPVYVASIDPGTGQLEEQQKWRKFTSKAEIEDNLPSVVSQNSQNGFNFCLIQCLRNNTSQIIKTVLSFPPVLEMPNSHAPKPPNLNLNVVVLSSVSRAHFYRSLPETVSTLRKIVYDNSITASVLDFEFFQSLGSDAVQNLRILLSGKNGKSSYQSSEISTLFAELKKVGYQNIFQTDQCWSEDEMQSKLETNGAREEFRKQWTYFQTMTTKHIDDTGLTYLACEALSQNDRTNQLDGNLPKASCLNGRYFFSYIFDYMNKIQHAKKVSKIKTPFFSYTHLTVTRDKLGVGIKQIDTELSTFLNTMAHEETAVTIVTSDQGPTTTKYSKDSVEGRYEIYDLILFMVIPKGVAAKFGKQQMEALVKNQHRLISPADLHKTLVSMGNLEGNNFARLHNKGLLAEIAENRTCAEFGVEVGALCKCHGWETWFPDNDPRFTWIAEFALGKLNNKLQDSIQKLKYLNEGNDICQRLVGYAFEKIFRNKEHNTQVLSLDLIVHPGRRVFEIQVLTPKHFFQEATQTILPSQTKEDLIKLIRFRKSGLLQEFSTLSDNDVYINLCLNDFHVFRNRTQIRRHIQAADGKYNEDVLEMAHRARHFGSRPRIQVLDRRNKCLLLITRAHSNHTLAFEASNICVDRTFVMKVDMMNRGEGHAFLTVHLPMIVQLAPGTYRFLLSAYEPRGVINLKPKIAFKVVKA